MICRMLSAIGNVFQCKCVPQSAYASVHSHLARQSKHTVADMMWQPHINPEERRAIFILNLRMLVRTVLSALWAVKWSALANPKRTVDDQHCLANVSGHRTTHVEEQVAGTTIVVVITTRDTRSVRTQRDSGGSRCAFCFDRVHH